MFATHICPNLSYESIIEYIIPKERVIDLANTDVRLQLFSGNNFTNRRIVLRRGGVAVRDLGAFRFDNVLSSFRLRNVSTTDSVTLVLFSRINFQGSIRIFRGRQNVSNLGNFNNLTSSLILVGRNLTNSQIQQIQSTGRPPRDILVIRQ
ncbi:hypothetical protein QFZ80_001518 [Paenibacillus sp. V4I7]|nr:hypothetical protein [Paenibacillus sp. V4I7]MDQ0916318.1 hypothetical protein [Paenibacillus sp. V4I5]